MKPFPLLDSLLKLTTEEHADCLSIPFGIGRRSGKSRLADAYASYLRLQEAQRPCPTDGRRKGRRKYGYKRFPSGGKRAR
jgi:hypothetical protein